MNSYITPSTHSTGTNSTTAPGTDRGAEPAGYVSTGRPAAVPTGYISPATHRGAGSYVATEWVTAA